MKFNKFLLTSIAVIAWGNFSQASPVLPADKSLLQAYKFVSSVLGDLENRERCPIQVIYAPLNGLYGYVEKSQKKCNDVIFIDSSLQGKVQQQIVFAHELTHLLRHQRNKNEVLWLDEGIAQLIEAEFAGMWPTSLENKLCGLVEFSLSNNPSDYRRDGAGYVTSYFFVKYLFNHLGDFTFIKKLVNSRLTGWASIEAAAREMSASGAITIPPSYLGRLSLWKHFSVALAANDTSYLSYGLGLMDYSYTPLIKKTFCEISKAGSVKFFGNGIENSFHQLVLQFKSGSSLVGISATPAINVQSLATSVSVER